MREFKADIKIDDSPEAVWKVLTDTDGYGEWAPNTEKMVGVFAVGSKLEIHLKEGRMRKFTVEVIALEKPEQIVLEAAMLLGLYKGVRKYSLTRDGDGTKFVIHEVVTGLLLPIMGGMLAVLPKQFKEFAANLKSTVEGSST